MRLTHMKFSKEFKIADESLRRPQLPRLEPDLLIVLGHTAAALKYDR